MVNHKEDLRRVDDSYDSIIINDANIDKLEDTQLLSLIDNQAGKTLRVLYDTVYKKKEIAQMMAINKKKFKTIYPRLKERIFLRRIFFHNVERRFIINVNVNINNYNHIVNHNYNQKGIQSRVIDIERIQNNEEKYINQTGYLFQTY